MSNTPAQAADHKAKRPWRGRLGIVGVAVAAILAGGAFALLVSGRDGVQPLAAEPSPTPSAAIQTPSPTASSSASPAPSATPAQTPEPTATPAPTSDGGAWIGPERIATRNYGQISLVVDATAVAHAAATLEDAIYYLTNASGAWTREPLTTAPPDGYDGNPVIAIDGDGSLAVAFVRYRGSICWVECPEPTPDAEGAYLVTKGSGNWAAPSRLPVEWGHSPGLALKMPDGSIHLAGSGVWYATNAGGEWKVETLVEAASMPSLALASDGTARMALGLGQALAYATASTAGGSFTVDQLPSGHQGWMTLLALDAEARPHVVYTPSFRDGGRDSGSLHTHWRDDSWTAPQPTFPEVDAQLHPCHERRPEEHLRGMAANMVLSSRGVVHVLTHNDPIYAGLWYSSNRNGVFEARQLHPPVDQDMCNAVFEYDPTKAAAMAIDHRGRPHVLFVTYAVESDRGFLVDRELWYAIGPGD